MKHCIVNFSDYQFKSGQDRLNQSLIDQKYLGDFILFNHHDEVGSKSHQEVPYQFKVYAIEKARQMGYDVVLYCDASIYAVKDVMPSIYSIIDKGYLMEHCGFYAGQFSTDVCLEEFNISRDEAMEIKLHSAGFTGINFQNEVANEFFNTWFSYAEKEITFKGAWSNYNKECSEDQRCLGHRHDQTTASIIAHNLQMDRTDPHFMQYLFNGTQLNQETIFACRGII